MKKRIIILLLLLASLAALAQSEAYLRYAPNPNLNVAFVEGFRLDDLMRWRALDQLNNLALSKQWYTKPKSIGTRIVQKNDPSQHVTELIHGEFDIETISFYYKRICIYHIINQQQYNSVFQSVIITTMKK